MHFKLTQKIEGVLFGREEYSSRTFEYHNPDITVVLRAKEKSSEQPEYPVVLCETVFQNEPSEEVQNTFKELSEGVYAKSDKADALLANLKERLNKGEISDYSLPYDFLPENFKDFYKDIYRKLALASFETYATLRWVDNMKGAVHPFNSSKLCWSYDGKEWKEFPPKFHTRIKALKGLSSSEKFREIIQSGASEPLGHELLREALSLQNSCTRSALLIGIAAAETGVKQCITYLQPETEWIIENIQSPPILRLLTDYIPKLPIKNRIKGKIDFPKNTILNPLEKGVQMRNKVAHVGNYSLTAENLSETLETVKSLLYLLDYYCGHNWALEHIGGECKKELGLGR